jgi:hypothetical protein
MAVIPLRKAPTPPAARLVDDRGNPVLSAGKEQIFRFTRRA